MILESKDIEDGGYIDPVFTCDGGDISPHLRWGDFPKKTKSFALMLIDNDGEMGTTGHWYVINIPKEVHHIPRGGPIPGKVVENDFKNQYYQVLCPKNGIHEFRLTIFALENKLDENINTITLRKILRKNAIDSADIKFNYKRKFDFKNFRFYSCHSCD